MIKYTIKDTHTQTTKGKYKTYNRAKIKADKLDMEYGAYRYIVTKAL